MSYEIKFLDGTVKTFESLTRANLTRANLKEADLRGADLEEANLTGANLRRANLTRADLRGANLIFTDLTRANLEGANLKSVNLYNTTGNNKEIKTIQLGTYIVNITDKDMQIGCELHSIEDWFNFDNEHIASMDRSALDWWNENKHKLKVIIGDSHAI